MRQLVLRDARRSRDVPVLIYPGPSRLPRPLAIISHGYGIGPGEYTFIANDLVRRGFVVASIRHVQLPGDPPMANTGDLARLRRPVWQVGADSIVFVIRELRREGVASRRPVVALGHSNGGDMTMLLAATRPDLLGRAISLDNRRMPIPRTRSPAMCTIRSVDQVADRGVLPSAAEAAAYSILVLSTHVKHNDMVDAADPAARDEMLHALDRCLAREPHR